MEKIGSELRAGSRFGRLVVISDAGRSVKGNRQQYLCKCDCGNEIVVIGKSLKSGNTKSCGCYKKQALLQANITHNLTKTPLYRVWATMKDRCFREKSPKYKDYGGRGITVCDEWLNDFKAFYNWSMANGYKCGLTLDRIDVNGNYEPSNCRWVTINQQANNKRNNIYLTKNGETHLAKEWSEILGINFYTIYSRKKLGFSDEECLSIKKLPRRRINK